VSKGDEGAENDGYPGVDVPAFALVLKVVPEADNSTN